MKDSKNCPLCAQILSRENDYSHSIFHCNCPNCGKYRITHKAFYDLEETDIFQDKRYLASGFIREMNDKKMPIEVITTNNFQNTFTNSHVPKTIMAKLNKLLQYIYSQNDFIYSDVTINYKMPSIAYAKNENELAHFCETLLQLKYIRFPSDRLKCQLTIEGIQEAEKTIQVQFDLKQCFVAMWFDDEMMTIYDDAISKAISDFGYNPFVIPLKEHNEDIFDHIILEIKKSKFIIADFTGLRGGVYYEAGFAQGYGLPVIYTCREDWFNQNGKAKKNIIIDGSEQEIEIDDYRYIHFDINHLNFIVWKDKNDLYDKLCKRIEATIE